MTDEDPTGAFQTFTVPLSVARPEPCISLLFYHRDGSQMVTLTEEQAVVVGRARPADIPIRDPSLSRQHARFSLLAGELWIEDLGSTNGTRVNGKKISQCKAKTTDEIQLGAVTVALHILPTNDAGFQGLENHDRFLVKLEQEITRGQAFGRTVAILMVQAAKRKQGHLNRWAPRVRSLLREVDLIALYDQITVLICLVESGKQEALALAEAIINQRPKDEPALHCGIAVFPEHGASPDELLETVRNTLQACSGRQPISMLGLNGPPALLASTQDAHVAINAKMKEIYATAKRTADTTIPVLIYGETGTGKEVLARVIHENSRRRHHSLHCINCASIPEQLIESVLFGHERGAFTGANQRAKGLFEEANNSTVLLDEIGELSPSVQAALLRVLETKRLRRVGSTKDLEVDVRILAATHRDLEKMCEESSFRWDLFYRLNTMVIKLPPLRDRPEEILPLADLFINAANKANQCRIKAIEPAAGQLLQKYSWPGNVRELRNVIERAVVIAQNDLITVDDLSERIRKEYPAPRVGAGDAGGDTLEGVDLKEKLKQYEAQLLLEALEAHGWNQTQTAKTLNMPLRTLVHKMRTLGLKKRYDGE